MQNTNPGPDQLVLTEAEQVFCTQISSVLRSESSAALASGMEAYMKHRFHFLGIKATQRRAALRDFKSLPQGVRLDAVVLWLFEQPFREMHYAAIDLLEAHMKKAPEERIWVYQVLLEQQQWWDTVDAIATKLMGFHLRQQPQLIPQFVERWMHSGDFWQQRTCVLFQLHYKSRTDTDLLLDTIRALRHSREFFIQKAIGWALRHYSRTDASWVRDVVQNEGLMPLSRREALRLIGA